MKKMTAWALTMLLLLTAVPGGFCSMTAERQAGDAFFEKLFLRADVVGGAVLISQKGNRVYDYFYGVEDRKTKQAVDETTVYKVASVTKMISAMGVMRLVDAGLIDLDEGLTNQDHFPIRNPRFRDTPITLRQVMSHTSSILGSAPYITPPVWEALTPADKKYFSGSAPGTHYEYANLNGGILCSVIERVTGQSFNTFMTENFFSPLNINAAFAAHLLPDASRLATAYYSDKTVYRRGYQYVETDAEEYDDTCDPDNHYRTSVGSLYISLCGLEKLGQALAGDGSVDGVQLLSGHAVRLMRQDQSKLPGSSVTGESRYGLCVSHFTGEDGVTWYGHQGRWGGLLTDLFFEPNTQTVVVFVLDGAKPGNNGQDIHPRAANALEYAAYWVHDAENSYVVIDE